MSIRKKETTEITDQGEIREALDDGKVSVCTVCKQLSPNRRYFPNAISCLSMTRDKDRNTRRLITLRYGEEIIRRDTRGTIRWCFIVNDIIAGRYFDANLTLKLKAGTLRLKNS